MHFPRQLLAVAAFSVLACADSPTAIPPDVVVGRFGGADLLVTAGPKGVRFFLPCAVVTVPAPLKPDASGAFALPPVVFRAGPASNSDRAVAVHGELHGDVLSVDVVMLLPAGTTDSEHFLVERDKPRNVTVACAAGSAR